MKSEVDGFIAKLAAWNGSWDFFYRKVIVDVYCDRGEI